jgi:hypothetical protein
LFPKAKEEQMRTLLKFAASLGVVSAIAVGGVAPAAADWYGRHHRYYDYYGGGGDPNGCPPGFSLQGGVCKPYQGNCPRGWTIQHGACTPF